MATYVPAKKNTEYIFYIALAAQSQANTFQSNPTIASGDFKVSIDGGALANLSTLPAVTPASSKMVKVTLSSSEMNGDNITVVGSDASGAEWRDIVVNIQTAARQIDDLATQASVDTVDDFLDTEIAAIKAKTDNLPTDPADDSDIDTQLAAIAAYIDTEVAAILAAVDTEVAAIKAKTDNLPAAPAATGDIPSAVTIAAAVWDRLTSALSTANSIGKLLVDNINATIGSRATQTSVDTIDDFLDTEVAAIKAKTDNLPTDPADASDIATATTTIAGYIDTEVASILAAVDTEVAAIKAKTDNLPASPAATGDIPTAAAIADAVLDDAITEPAGSFAWGSATLRNITGWMGALARNKILQTDTESTLRNDADDTDIAVSEVSDDGTTLTRGEWG